MTAQIVSHRQHQPLPEEQLQELTWFIHSGALEILGDTQKAHGQLWERAAEQKLSGKHSPKHWGYYERQPDNRGPLVKDLSSQALGRFFRPKGRIVAGEWQ